MIRKIISDIGDLVEIGDSRGVQEVESGEWASESGIQNSMELTHSAVTLRFPWHLSVSDRSSPWRQTRKSHIVRTFLELGL